jgi:Cytochrome P460
VAHEEGNLNDLRAILGNDVAIKASREGKLPFPDGAIIARLAWSYDPLLESEKAFGRLQSFVAGAPKNGVQFMIKDSKKYASTGGWGFAQFDDGKPADEKVQNTCFPLSPGRQGSRLCLQPLRTLILRTTAEKNGTMTTHALRRTQFLDC